MSHRPTEQPSRTPYCHKIRYGITGAPILTEDEMDGTHAPGIGVAPTLIELVYHAARDGKPASVSASVTGWWTRFGERDQPEQQVATHFKDGPDGWPAWLAEEARLHDPAVQAPAADQAAPSRCTGPEDGLRRMADEAQPAPPQPDEAPVVCEGFVWIGQSFANCDRCSQPAWDHAGEEVPVEGAGPFDNRRTVRPWEPGQADAIRAKWAPKRPADEAQQDGAQQ